jgi:hypothetical protein
MLENVREDIRAGTWHDVPAVRARFGEPAGRTAAVLLPASLQVVLVYRFQAITRASARTPSS